jgi:hypothetical protein
VNKATVTLAVGALASVLVQLAGRHGIALDPATANQITYALVVLALGAAGSHVSDARDAADSRDHETNARKEIAVATIAASVPPAPTQQNVQVAEVVTPASARTTLPSTITTPPRAGA